MSKFNIDDIVWVAQVGRREVTKPCDICYGKKKVTLILGNGDMVELPCDYCGRGFDPPSGMVTEYEFVSDVQTHTITRISTERTSNGEKNTYYAHNYVFDDDGIFNTQEEAEAKVVELCKEREEEEKTRAKYLKQNVNKSYAWNAGYHLREIKRLEKQTAFHKSKVVLCQAKAQQEAKCSGS